MIATKKKKKLNGRRRKIRLFKCQTSNTSAYSNFPSLMQQEETFISVLTGLYTECPHYRNTQTYTGPESNQVKNVDLATENRSFEKSTVQAYKLS